MLIDNFDIDDNRSDFYINISVSNSVVTDDIFI